MNYIILGNVVSFVGCILMVSIGFVQKKERILGMQCLQFGIMGVSNLLLGAVSGTISNAISIVRNLAFTRLSVTKPLKLFFIALQILLSAGTLRQSALEWLPIFAAGLFTWFLDVKSEVTLKIVIIATAAMWVVYDFCHQNYVAMTFDLLTMASNFIGIMMIRRGQQPKP